MENKGEIVVYQPDEITRLEVMVENETVWLTQVNLAQLFGVNQPAVSKHIRNIYASGELTPEDTYSILEYMGNDGKQMYSVNTRLNTLEDRIERRLAEQDRRLDDHEQKIDFFVRTSLPPVEGIFYDGQIFDAYVFVNDPITISQTRNIHDRFLIIDNDVYHIGASLKDLGKKHFAFSKMYLDVSTIYNK